MKCYCGVSFCAPSCGCFCHARPNLVTLKEAVDSGRRYRYALYPATPGSWHGPGTIENRGNGWMGWGTSAATSRYFEIEPEPPKPTCRICSSGLSRCYRADECETCRSRALGFCSTQCLLVAAERQIVK